MNWITVLLILLLIGQLAGFGYLIYLVWKEIKATLKDANRLKQPIEGLIQQSRGLPPLVELLTLRMNRVTEELQIIAYLGRETKEQVAMLSGAVAELRSPNVKLAIRYGRNWIEERRANPVVRKLKRAARKLKKRFGKFGL